MRLIEGRGRDRLGFECLVPGLEGLVFLPPTLQGHAPEQVVLGLDRLAVEAPRVDCDRRVVAAHPDRRPSQEPQRGRIAVAALEDLAGGLSPPRPSRPDRRRGGPASTDRGTGAAGPSTARSRTRRGSAGPNPSRFRGPTAYPGPLPAYPGSSSSSGTRRRSGFPTSRPLDSAG